MGREGEYIMLMVYKVVGMDGLNGVLNIICGLWLEVVRFIYI